MNNRKELLEIPLFLRKLYEDGLLLYENLVRGVNWTGRPVFMVGSNSGYLAALSGRSAFESLLGLPVVARRASVFSAYTFRALSAHSLVIAVSVSGECKETLQAAKSAKSRGAVVWAVTSNPESPLADLAEAVVNCYEGSSPEGEYLSVFRLHAVMLFLAVAAARVLKAPEPIIRAHSEDIARLASHVEWVLDQIPDAGKELAARVAGLPALEVVGGGPFHPVALQTARLLGQAAGVRTSGYELAQFREISPLLSLPGAGILYLSSSRSKLKEQVLESIREVRQKNQQKIFAVTDAPDRQLSARADMAVLLPSVTEAAGALLSLAFLELVLSYALKLPSSGPPGSGRAPESISGR